MTNYSNPRMHLTKTPLAPAGSSRDATFVIEVHPTRGERATRTTTGAKKVLTYARKARIVDGDDGKTYIAQLTAAVYGRIVIMQGSNMKYHHEVVFPGEPRYAELKKLFEDES